MNSWKGRLFGSRPNQLVSSSRQESREMSTQNESNKSNDEIKEINLKKLYQLSLKSICKNIELEELTEEQKQWVKKHGF